jgi:hypothetical protein
LILTYADIALQIALINLNQLDVDSYAL